MTAKASSSTQCTLITRDKLHPFQTEKTEGSSVGVWPFSASNTETEAWRLVAEEDTGRLRWQYLRSRRERETLPHDPATRYFQGLSTVSCRKQTCIGVDHILT